MNFTRFFYRLSMLVLVGSIGLAGCIGVRQEVQPPTALPNTALVMPSPTAPSTAQPPAAETPIQQATPAQVTAVSPQSCTPTPSDMLGPFFTPGAPVRDKVGEGYLLQGVVRSAADCSPVDEAQLEFWMAGPDGQYADAYRATLFSFADGSYHFESHSPPGYSGRPPHIHIRVCAEGFHELVTQHYPVTGETGATFDLVLIPVEGEGPEVVC